MTIRRILTLGAVAVAALMAFAMATVWWFTRAEPAVAVAAAPPAPADEPPPVLATGLAQPAMDPPPVVPRPASIDPRPPTKDPRPVRSTRLTGRFTGVPTDFFAALRPHGQAVSRCAGPAHPPSAMRTVMLTLQTLDGKIRVSEVSVPKATPGADDVLRCARAELVGRELAASDSVAGRAYTMPYPLPR